MRKPRDIDSELKALADKAKQLKERRVRQFGELVAVTGADAFDAETLAGALRAAATTKDSTLLARWRKDGAAFFSGQASKSVPDADRDSGSALPLDGGAASA